MGKATNFKFGRYIQRVHTDKSRLKSCEKLERGRIQGLPKFFEYLLLSQERIKLRTSNLAGIHRVHPNKSPLKFLEKRQRGRIKGMPNFFEYPLLFTLHFTLPAKRGVRSAKTLTRATKPILINWLSYSLCRFSSAKSR